jgi:putative redox protein
MQALRVVTVGDHCKPPYQQEVRCGRHTLVVDEPLDRGGLDCGPSPWGYLLSSLGACTAIALRAHCERRSWPVCRVMVTLQLAGPVRSPSILRAVHIRGTFTAAQFRRLAAVCEGTPVTLALKRGIQIKTQVSLQAVALPLTWPTQAP